MEYYYTASENIFAQTGELIIAGTEFQHVFKVLKKRAGDEITITDGNGNVYMCVISLIYSDKAKCRILGTQYDLFEPSLKLNLFLAPLKSRERFEFAIEKAVELGVHSVTPVLTKYTVKRSEYSGQKSERIRNIIIRAMCQSQRCRLPEFHTALFLEDLVKETFYDPVKIVMYEFAGENSAIPDLSETASASLLVGPEGGFDENEVEFLLENGWTSLSLGSRKLRAETAVIISVHNLINNKLTGQ
jgi:16S rRNA (uracil1498-N3)-methyltransferase